MAESVLISRLRARLQDDRWSVPAFTIACLDRHATDVYLNVSNQLLTTSVISGSPSTAELSVSLVASDLSTLGELVSYLRVNHGSAYRIEAVQGMNDNHASDDIEVQSNVSILRTGVTLRTRRFSDTELLRLFDAGARRHNPNYTIDNVPDNEANLVLALAHVEALRVLASDAVKRRGMDLDVSSLLRLATDIEVAYQADVRRLAKVLRPLRSEDDAIREGDVVVGDFSRMSLRTGFMAPGFANLQPQAPLLYTPTSEESHDYGIIVRWRRSRESNLFAIELWRDTQPDVRRSRDGNAVPTTSKLVWSSRWGGRVSSTEPESFGYIDNAGELTSGFIDGFLLPTADTTIPVVGALEPNTTYYYRLYIGDSNGEWAASDVVQGTTKLARARFRRDPNPFSVQTGVRAGGTVFTIAGANFAAGVVVRIGGKTCTVVVDSATQLTVTSPATGEFTTPEQDVVIESLNGLKDVYPNGWTYT